LIEYDDYIIEKKTYKVVRVTLKTRPLQNIFKEPMLILTNRQIKTLVPAHGIYFRHEQRSKIEGVFKFLKDVQGFRRIPNTR